MSEGHAIRASAGAGLDICLAVPPFDSAHYPNLATAVLKSACAAKGLSTRILYGGLQLAALAGLERYDAVYDSQMHEKVGERLYRPHAYPPDVFAAMEEPHVVSDRLMAIHDAMAPFIVPALDALAAQVLALKPRILGITSGFQQNLAASALALRVKAAAPEIVIVMGGPNVAGPLADGLAKAWPWVDHFFSGEADVDFPAFCEALVRHGERPAGRVIHNEPIRDMRTVFAPDFTDYFEQLRAFQAEGRLPEWLPRYLMAESSRGCWWGAKNHCTFCGLNAEGMDFRDKPASRMIEELKALEQWQVGQVMMTDNIMPRQYLRDLLPVLAEDGPHVGLFYEVKANLSSDDIDTMVRGGLIAIQPGIESLSSNVLKLMRKGVSGHQNIALLRNCAGVGMQVTWNILHGFPGETREDYSGMLALMPKLHHLAPPGGWTRIVIDRYSPFYRDPIGMGIGPLTPQSGYAGLYPADVPVDEVAYHFQGDYSTGLLDDAELCAALRAGVDAWQEAGRARAVPMLRFYEARGAVLVADTRAIARQAMTPLSAAQYEALCHFERPHVRDGIDPALDAEIDWLLARDFLIEHEGKLMSVVVRVRHDVQAPFLRGELEAAA